MNKTLITTTALLVTAIAAAILWALSSNNTVQEAQEPLKKWLGRS